MQAPAANSNQLFPAIPQANLVTARAAMQIGLNYLYQVASAPARAIANNLYNAAKDPTAMMTNASKFTYYGYALAQCRWKGVDFTNGTTPPQTHGADYTPQALDMWLNKAIENTPALANNTEAANTLRTRLSTPAATTASFEGSIEGVIGKTSMPIWSTGTLMVVAKDPESRETQSAEVNTSIPTFNNDCRKLADTMATGAPLLT